MRDTESELDSEKKIRREEVKVVVFCCVLVTDWLFSQNAEWEQFQNDLLMTVRVANDFKTEAQQELQNLVLENKAQRDKVRALESQIEKIKAQQGTVVLSLSLIYIYFMCIFIIFKRDAQKPRN